MEIFKNKWFQLTAIILVLLISYSFYWVIFHYPYWVKSQVTLINGHVKNASDLNEGTFGDMYGALNSFVSGLAFLGLLITIGIQIWLHYREQQFKKEEKLNKADNKLAYLNLLVNQSFSEIDTFKDGVNELIRNNSLEKNRADFFTDDDILKHNKINKIVNKIDQELFFTAYFQKYKKQDLISLFESFDELLKSWKSFIKKIGGQEEEYKMEISKLKNAFLILQDQERKELSFPSNGHNTFVFRIICNSNALYFEEIGNIENPLEIYYKVQEEKIKDFEKRVNLPEVNEYLENCIESIEKIESIKCKIVELCSEQITDITNRESVIKNVKIIKS
jgi:hypothetical protein